VLETVRGTLHEAGYEVKKECLALSKDGQRFFGTLDLSTSVASGVCLAVGVRNSTDKSFPLGFCAGERVFVCDNLAFHSELMVRRKHTLHGEARFSAAIADAVVGLGTFREEQEHRIKRLQHMELPPEVSDSLILRSFERGIINSHQLPKVIKEWREPSFEEFQDKTAWSLLNAYTTVLRDRATSHPTQFAAQTMRLHAILDDARKEYFTAV
jgi:hypothetical protein